MIALGESILAIGAAAGFTLSAGQGFAALFGIAAVAALWWAYFDVIAIVAERRLSETQPGEQAPLARDAYSYLHFPLIAASPSPHKSSPRLHRAARARSQATLAEMRG